MKYIPTVLFILLICSFKYVGVSGQNLVINPSFEMSDTCHFGSPHLVYCSNWSSGGALGTRYYSACGPPGSIPPNLPFGLYQNPRTGNSMVELTSIFDTITTSYGNQRQFLCGKLASPLLKGQTYHLGFYINLDQGGCITDNFGIYLTDTPQKYNYFKDSLSNFSPQVQNPNGSMLTDTQGWMPVKGIIMANGGEQYIFLGSFKDDKHTRIKAHNASHPYFSYYFVDDVFVIPINYPALLTSHDTILCPGQKLILHTTAGHSFKATWQDGSIVDSFVVTKAGKYVVSFDSLGYVVKDSINVGYDTVVSGFPKKMVVCDFPNTVSTSPSNLKYSWPDGSFGNQFTAKKEGLYYYEVQSNSCTVKDSISFSLNYLTWKLKPDTSICAPDTLSIDVSDLGNNIIWQDSSTNKIYKVSHSGNYRLFIKTDCGEIEKDIKVYEGDCRCALWVPNIFIPEANHFNQSYKMVASYTCPPTQFELKIYNRLVEKVFQSTNIETAWDGTFKDNPCPEGVYVYYLSYTLLGQTNKIQKGTITLLR